jgi:hypothetical protein
VERQLWRDKILNVTSILTAHNRAVIRKALAVLNSGTGNVDRCSKPHNKTINNEKEKKTRESYRLQSEMRGRARGTPGWEPMHDSLLY